MQSFAIFVSLCLFASARSAIVEIVIDNEADQIEHASLFSQSGSLTYLPLPNSTCNGKDALYDTDVTGFWASCTAGMVGTGTINVRNVPGTLQSIAIHAYHNGDSFISVVPSMGNPQTLVGLGWGYYDIDESVVPGLELQNVSRQ